MYVIFITLRQKFKVEIEVCLPFKLERLLVGINEVIILLYLLDDISFSLLKLLINDLLALNVSQFNSLAF